MKSSKEDDAKCKRHCMVVHAYYPLGETRVQREAEALLRHHYSVDVVCLRKEGEPAEDVFKGARIYRLSVRRHRNCGLVVQFLEYLAFFLLAMFKVSRLCWRQRYSTLQVHNLPDFLVFSAWFPKLLGAKLILDLHDLMPEFYVGRFERDANSLPVRLVRLQERLACHFADHVITVSHHWRQVLVERGVASDNISVVMNVADDVVFRPQPERARQAQTDPGLHLIYHGAVTYRYGLDLALQAMAQLRHQVSDIHLTVLGAGDYMETLIRMAGELELDGQVTFFRGFRPAEELPEIIMANDVGIVPYRDDTFTDSLVPTKLMEYAALGLPAIAARTTAISSYFDDSMVEFFTPGSADELAHCILQLYTDRTRLTQLAQGVDKFNQRYNWSKIGAEYVRLVERLSVR